MAQKKTLYMETTEVPAERTAAEVSAQLINAGATQIATSYDQGKVIGLRWTMKANGADALFEMPARVDPITKIFMDRQRNTWLNDNQKAAIKAKAERVAWRQLLRWVQAQVAMIETGMVQPAEVFTAYWIPPGSDKTLFQFLSESKFKALPAPEKPS